MAEVTSGGAPSIPLDTLGMWRPPCGFPEQVEAAIEVGLSVEGLPPGESVANILVLGMGGSGIAGDVLAAVADQFLSVPVVVAKGYERAGFSVGAAPPW